jgi:hypothetical protein
MSRDSFAGWPEQPYSLHSYAYALSDPVRYTDPTGKRFDTGQESCPAGYVFDESLAHATDADMMEQGCIPELTNLPPPWIGEGKDGEKRTDLGIIFGVSGALNSLEMGVDGGVEAVYDLYDFESAIFTYGGEGVSLSSWSTTIKALTKYSCPASGGGSAYIGGVTGWSNFENKWIGNYSGPFRSYSVGILPPKFPLIVGGQGFHSLDGNMWGAAISLGVGDDRLPFGGSILTNHYSEPYFKTEYHGRNSLNKPLPPTLMETMLFQAEVSLILTISPLTQPYVSQISSIIAENARIWNREYRREAGLYTP